MLDPRDPLLGWYDRMLEKGEHLQMYRNLPRVINVELGEPFDLHAWKEHLVSCGYASQKTADILWPEPEPEPQKEGRKPDETN